MKQIERENSVENKSRGRELMRKGTGAWLGSPPIKVQGRYLAKSEFQDALRLRLGIEPENIPSRCPCGTENTVNHGRNCHLGGYVNMRHDKVRDLIVKKAARIYKDVEKEPKLRPVEEQTLKPGTNRNDGARSDIRILGFNREF